MIKLQSKDGTTIALERSGDGPAVVLVSGALGGRASNAQLAALLADDFTVLNHDRRGRGDSGDTHPYAVEREVEDLAAVVESAGEDACVFGTSSGGNLALEAARRGVTMRKLALWEPNFLVDGTRVPLPHDYVQQLEKLVASGRPGDAIELFMTAAVGLPADVVTAMRDMPAWSMMEASAHTLAYDGAVVGDCMAGTPLRRERWTPVHVPTLVLDGGQTPWMSAGADALADALARAQRRTLAGQTHDVAPEALAPALKEFFGE